MRGRSGGGGTPVSGFIPDEDFKRLKALIIDRTGHFYYQDKDGALWERVRRRLLATGDGDVASYLERLSDPDQGEAEWGALEAEVTIGETFFFRYAEQFAALRDTILPDIIARKRAERRIRIWSAGCASGAEAYSVAILLRRLLEREIDDWRIGITGTDINEAVLAVARKGQYGRWALRSLSSEELEQDFVPADGDKGWTLRPQYRAMVRFQRHNLMSLLDGTSPLQFTELDLILCRNVLIYFHPDTVTQIVRALGERLAEDGWLLLGHAEPNPEFSGFLRPISLPGTIAYRPLTADGPPPQEATSPAASAPAAAPPIPSIEPWALAPPSDAPSGATPVPPPRPSESRAGTGAPAPEAPPAPGLAGPAEHSGAAETAMAEVRSRADRGDFDGARQACRDGLAAAPTDAVLHFYDGLIARALDMPAEAEAAFRRAIYLRKNFVMAHYQLGLLLLDTGRRSAGRRAVAAAARLALSLPRDSALEEGDGLTAGELRAIARLHVDKTAHRDAGSPR